MNTFSTKPRIDYAIYIVFNYLFWDFIFTLQPKANTTPTNIRPDV